MLKSKTISFAMILLALMLVFGSLPVAAGDVPPDVPTGPDGPGIIAYMPESINYSSGLALGTDATVTSQISLKQRAKSIKLVSRLEKYNTSTKKWETYATYEKTVTDKMSASASNVKKSVPKGKYRVKTTFTIKIGGDTYYRYGESATKTK